MRMRGGLFLCAYSRGCSVQLMFDGDVGFTGVVGAVLGHGKEYRLATYLGARVERIGLGEVVVRQRGLRLTARLREPTGQPLCALDASFVYEYPR